MVDLDVRFFPRQSIQFCLDAGRLRWEDLDVVCLAFDLRAILASRQTYARGFPGIQREVLQRRFHAFRDYVTYLRKLCSGRRTRLVFVRHHLAHTAGALFSSRLRRANVLTMDGMGEFDAARLSVWNGRSLERVAEAHLPHSMGRVYSATTAFLGFRSNREEEKVMALAGYGTPRYLEMFRRLVWKTRRGFRVDPAAFWGRECEMGFSRLSTLPDHLGVVPRPTTTPPLEPPYPDVAASLQEILFEVSSHLCGILHEQSGYRDLAIAGGVGLNCDNNGRLLTETGFVNNVWVQPQAGDAGAALGAAYWTYFASTGRRPEPMEHVYFGRGWDDAEIERLLKEWQLAYDPSADIAGEVAEEILAGRIAGWFQGRSEAGPRALGDRSLLALPTASSALRMNRTVKHRETWRPFSPSLADDARKRFLVPDLYAPFMTIALPVRPERQPSFEGVTHVTGTARVQTLRRAVNPLYYELIRGVGSATGSPVVLNTSFNVAGEPIVDSPREAVIDFLSTGMDVLGLGSFILRKPGARAA